MSEANPAAPLLEVKDLYKSFGSKQVLRGVNLRVERGETVVIVGGSGCGKTTLARIIAGLETPSSGQVLLEGEDLGEMSERERIAVRERFAMVFQKAGLLDSFTVFDNLAFPLRERGLEDEAQIRDRVMRTLEELGVGQTARQMPAELSGGMAKRVGIARAVAMEPEILVYDEPTSGLDPVSSRMVDGLIEQMREHFWVSSVVITHDMISAFAIGDRVLLLDAGQITAEESAATLATTESEKIREFAVSSGVELERLSRRTDRPSAESIRAAWEQANPVRADRAQHWLARFLQPRKSR